MSVCAGIDVHRKRSQVAVIGQDGEVLASRNVPGGAEPMGAQHSWQQPCQRRQDCPVGPVRLGRVIWRRSTAISWRSAMISASLDASPRPSSISQPKTRIMIK